MESDSEGDRSPVDEFWQGFRMMRCFPVVGESAFADLWFEKAVWAQVSLRGVRQDEVGEARIEGVEVDVALFPPPPDKDLEWWTFDHDDVVEQLAKARQWLLDNEAGRLPMETDGLTAAGAAISKAAPDEPMFRSVADEEV